MCSPPPMSGFDALLQAADKQALDDQREMVACVKRITTLETRLEESEKKIDGLLQKPVGKEKEKEKEKRRRPLNHLVKSAGVHKRLPAKNPLRKCQACKVVKRSMKECGPVAGGRCGCCVRLGKRCIPSYDRRRKDVVGGRWCLLG